MTLVKCANPCCSTLVSPSIAGRFRGCCSASCERQMFRMKSKFKPSGIVPEHIRRRFHVRHGHDRRCEHEK